MRTDDVVVVVLQRLFDRLANGLEASKVDDRRAIVLAKGSCNSGLITDIAFDQLDFTASNRLDPFQRFWMAIAEVVEDNHILTSAKKFDTGMRADIASPASYEDHRSSPSDKTVILPAGRHRGITTKVKYWVYGDTTLLLAYPQETGKTRQSLGGQITVAISDRGTRCRWLASLGIRKPRTQHELSPIRRAHSSSGFVLSSTSLRPVW